mgnify:CR=1 FL=1
MLDPIKIHVNCLTGYSPNCFPKYFKENLVKRIIEIKETETNSLIFNKINFG